MFVQNKSYTSSSYSRKSYSRAIRYDAQLLKIVQKSSISYFLRRAIKRKKKRSATTNESRSTKQCISAISQPRSTRASEERSLIANTLSNRRHLLTRHPHHNHQPRCLPSQTIAAVLPRLSCVTNWPWVLSLQSTSLGRSTSTGTGRSTSGNSSAP